MSTIQSPLDTPSAPESYNDLRYQKDNGLYEMFLTWHKRLNRMRYFKRLLALGITATVLLMIIVATTSNTLSPDAAIVSGSINSDEFALSTGGSLLFMLVFFASWVSHYMLMIRRLHDLNKTGWLALLVLVPVVNVFFALYLLFAPGSVGANDYGADPLECVE
ncbi:MAG: DUF805 domain-containing protein [Selenomonadaceae bacterium]|nr:DUF805 domain-containing protein [Selenomonadaceae bacterium]